MPVIDTGLVMAYLLNEPSGVVAIKVILGTDVHVPDILRLETANALITAMRRGRISPAQVAPRYDLVNRMKANFHESSSLIQRSIEISQRYHRRPYDGVFIALAEKLGQELITLDATLVRSLNGTLLEKRVRLLE